MGSQQQITDTPEEPRTQKPGVSVRSRIGLGLAWLTALLALALFLYAVNRLPFMASAGPPASGGAPAAPQSPQALLAGGPAAVVTPRAPTALPTRVPAAAATPPGPTAPPRATSDLPDAAAVAASQARLAALTEGYQTALAATATAAGTPAATVAVPTVPPTAAPAPPTAAPTPSGVVPAAATIPHQAANTPAPAVTPATPTAAAPPGHAFVQQATPANIETDGTTIENAAVSATQDPILLVTANGSPAGRGRMANKHISGVYESAGKWFVYNQDLAPMAADTAFNVAVLAPGPATAIHAATTANTAGADTVLDIPAANDHPDAILLVTSNWNPGLLTGVYNNHPLGVAYRAGRWHISNADSAAIPVGAAFNVVVLPPGPATFVQHSTPANTAGDATVIDYPPANGRTDAVVIITANHASSSAPDAGDPHALGVDYAAGHWRIFHQDGTPLAVGAAFNVAVWLPAGSLTP